MTQNDQSLEEAVLGAVLLEKEAIETAIVLLKPEHFYNDSNKMVFRAIQSIFKRNESIDILTVTNELKKNNILESVGGSYFVSSLTSRIASSANIEVHCRIIIQKYILRKLSELSKKLDYKSSEPSADSFDVMEWMQKELRNIEDGLQFNKTERIESIIEAEISEMRETIKSGIKPGVLSSIQVLNNQTSGWQKGDLIILAGRPGMGKTSAALDFALNPALNGSSTVIFSLEMSKSQLGKRVLSLISSMPVQKIVTKNVNNYDVDLLEKDGKILKDVPLFIDDSAGINLIELSAKARRLKREQNIELIVVDYIQLMGGVESKFGNREQEISRISRGLKLLAKELEIPIIALSQLSRAVELRPDRKPQLSDLRESGAIEQDADMVIFCFRPEYYGFDTYSIGGNDIPSFQLFIFIIAKFRQGQPGEIKARWIGELTKIDNY
jgi:replicative DNA helicase